MIRPTRVIATVGVFAAFIAPAAASASPTVVLLHPGGWLTGSAASMTPWVQDFRAHGIHAVSLDYPLGDVARAQRYVDTIVSLLPSPVVAYGESAGATLSASLAARGKVAAAVNVVGPTDFATWDTPVARTIMRLLPRLDRRAASPINQVTPDAAPTLNQCGKQDPWVPCSQALEFVHAARRYQPDTRRSVTSSAHGQLPSGMLAARRWIERRFGRGA